MSNRITIYLYITLFNGVIYFLGTVEDLPPSNWIVYARTPKVRLICSTTIVSFLSLFRLITSPLNRLGGAKRSIACFTNEEASSRSPSAAMRTIGAICSGYGWRSFPAAELPDKLEIGPRANSAIIRCRRKFWQS